MSILTFRNVALRYPARPGRGGAGEKLVLDGINLQVASDELVAIIGRSGSGKTSLLNLAAGFIAPSAGTIALDGEPVRGPGADRAVVFQDDALYPWLDARDNIAFPLKLRGIPLAERRAQADALLARVGLAEAGDRRIWELSGGMRQRVGIARALAAEPRFLLLDEPLGALDALTRIEMQGLIESLWRRLGFTALLVTHDVSEAVALADRIVLIEDGHIAMDERVALPRPRQHGSAAFAQIEERVLRRVMQHTPDAGAVPQAEQEPTADWSLVRSYPATYDILVSMADTSVEQFRRALRAWSGQDLALADELARSGAVLDLANTALVRALLDLEGPSAVPAALHSLVIGKALDRIADHSAIIGSRLRYLLTGDPGHLAAEIR